MADDELSIDIQLHTNMQLIDIALDGGDRARFRLLAKRRLVLKRRLERAMCTRTRAEV